MDRPTSTDAPIGVIAGAGRFPFMVVDGAKRCGHRVVIVGLRGFADPKLAGAADEFHWAGLARVGRWIRIFKGAGVERATMAGFVRKQLMYGRFRLLKLWPDYTSLVLWFGRLRDKRNDSVLKATADVLQSKGITLESCVQYCADALAPP